MFYYSPIHQAEKKKETKCSFYAKDTILQLIKSLYIFSIF